MNPAVVIAVPLVIIAAWWVCYGMQEGWRLTLGQVLIDFADWLGGVGISISRFHAHPFGPVAAGIKKIVAAVDWALGRAVNLTEKPIVWVLHQIADVLNNVGDELGSLAEDVTARLKQIEDVVIPQAVAIGTFPARVALDMLRATVHYATAVTLPALAHTIDLTRDRVGRLERDIKSFPGRLSRLEKATVGLGAAALVAWAVARVGLGWIRCRNVTKAGRGVCRMDTGILDTLLADATMIFGAISIVEFAEALLEIEEPLVDAMTAGFTELRDIQRT